MDCQGLTSYQTKKFLDPNVVSPIDHAPFTIFYHLRSVEKTCPRNRFISRLTALFFFNCKDYETLHFTMPGEHVLDFAAAIIVRNDLMQAWGCLIFWNP